MSNDKDINDPRVTTAYRGLATETTPSHLDRRVLAAARAGARTRYGLARAWMRPLAWAATIALSFAFVLQMMQVDQAPPPAEPAILQERAEPAPAPATDEDSLAKQRRVTEAELMKAKELTERDVPQAPARPALDPAPAADAAAAPAGFAAETEERVIRSDNAQTTRGRSAAEPAETLAATASTIAEPRFCDDDARADAARWFACIEDLRDAGREEAAAAELEALQAAFPDFRIPDPN